MRGPPAASFTRDATRTYTKVARCIEQAAKEARDDRFERSFLLAGQVVTLSVLSLEAGQLLYAPFSHLPPAGDSAQVDLSVRAMDFDRYGPPLVGDTSLVNGQRVEDQTFASGDG